MQATGEGDVFRTRQDRMDIAAAEHACSQHDSQKALKVIKLHHWTSRSVLIGDIAELSSDAQHDVQKLRDAAILHASTGWAQPCLILFDHVRLFRCLHHKCISRNTHTHTHTEMACRKAVKCNQAI